MKKPGFLSSIFFIFLVWVSAGVFAGCLEFKGDPPELGHYAYGPDQSVTRCALDERQGRGGVTNDEQSESGIIFSVRTPANYDPTVSHPLLMVYAPAGSSRFRSERFTDLTFAATAAGFVVAYADARRLSLDIIPDLGTIPQLIAKKWCIDEKRIYLTGHSDGGTVALALALLDETHHIPAAIAPSAAGFTKADLETFSCPDALPAMILHSADDQLFPGYGAEIASWLAACNGCQQHPGEKDENGCMAYSDCKVGGKTVYCEGTGSHIEWPALNTALLSFFADTRP